MSDDLRAALEEAAEQVESEVLREPETVAESEPVIEENIETSDQQTSESAASQDASTPVVDDPSKGVEAPSGEVKSIEEVVAETPEPVIPAEDVNVPDSKLGVAPASWKGDAKALWSDLPETAREEIVRRERQTQQVLNDTANDRKRVQEISQVFNSHSDIIQANYGGNPIQAVNGLLGVERVLTSGNVATKAQLVAKIITDFGVDINALDSLLSGGELAPEIRQQSEVDRIVNERLAPVMGYVQQQQQREQQQRDYQRNQVVSSVEQMASDTVNFPYFNDVRMDMADIMEMSAKRGVDLSIKEAYDKAVMINGRTATAVDTRQSVQAETQTALQAHQEAQKAKGASVSVSGNPTSVGTPPPTNTDLRSLISSALDNGGQRV